MLACPTVIFPPVIVYKSRLRTSTTSRLQPGFPLPKPICPRVDSHPRGLCALDLGVQMPLADACFRPIDPTAALLAVLFERFAEPQIPGLADFQNSVAVVGEGEGKGTRVGL